MNPLDKLEAMGRAYISFGLENREFYELTYLTNSVRAERNTPCSISEPDFNSHESPAYKAFNLLVQVVKESQAEGYFSGRDVLLISQTMWAGLHGLVSLNITHPEFPWVDKEDLIKDMLRSIMQ